MSREPTVYCERVLQEDVAVAYLRGELPEEERDAFERHFFECAACYERLRVIRDLGTVLRQERGAVPRAVAPTRQAIRPAAASWLAWAAGATFVAVGAAMVLRNMAPPAPLPSTAPTASSPAAQPSAAPPSTAVPERPPLEVLARVEPPPYAPLVVRGTDPAETAFARAMDHYVRGDYVGAASGLRATLKEEPDSAEARFYLGVSELLAGRPEQAIAELRRVAGGEDASFAEAARYNLAKAHLARRDVAGARRELQRVARGEGDHKERAQQLLQALGAEP